MSLLSFLEKTDGEVLIAINGCNSQELDWLMWWISDRWVWLPLYLLLAVAVIWRFGRLKGIALILVAAGIAVLTDLTCASVVRPAVMRLRPSNPDNPVSAFLHVVNGYRGGSYGFPSCHAANTFALAVFISLLFRNRYVSGAMFLWSVLVSYSRIYLGVHYPADIFGGFVIGGSYSVVCSLIVRRIDLSVGMIRRRIVGIRYG